MYPAKDRDEARKPVTLQNISNRLERLEVLLERFFEGSQVTTGSAADHRGGGQSQTQIQAQQRVHVNSIGTANKSTWQLLWNDEQVAQSASSSDIEKLVSGVKAPL